MDGSATRGCPWETAPRYVGRDRDAVYGVAFSRRVQTVGIHEVRTAPRSPWQNPYVSRPAKLTESAGGSPAWVSADAPSSRPRFRGETPRGGGGRQKPLRKAHDHGSPPVPRYLNRLNGRGSHHAPGRRVGAS